MTQTVILRMDVPPEPYKVDDTEKFWENAKKELGRVKEELESAGINVILVPYYITVESIRE